MCTISFIPLSDSGDFIFTSNRDEAEDRPTIPPKSYTENGEELLYPKDKIAGGTWIGTSSRKRLICLMNGAKKAHTRKPAYKKSRGVVVKDLLTAKNFEQAVGVYNFEGIEPFTIICVTWNSGVKLYELFWDEAKVECNLLANKSQIWSASMTYTTAMKEERHQWFWEFINTQTEKQLDENKIWRFHHEAGANDDNNGFVINRGKLKTTSITQFSRIGKTEKMRFENLLTGKETQKILKIED